MAAGWPEGDTVLTHKVLTVSAGGPGLVLPNDEAPIRAWGNGGNFMSPRDCYQGLFEYPPDRDILIYIHDDVTIHDENWLACVVGMFHCHPECGVIGLGGATELGHKDMYKVPYRLPMMARNNYMSNQTDWQTHGSHLKKVTQAVVVDAFFMAIRTDLLLEAGGWPKQLTHHCLDLWLACEAARRGYETWLVPVSVTHHGGGTSTKPSYAKASWLQGGSLELDHQLPHRWLYEEYRDVLPLRLP